MVKQKTIEKEKDVLHSMTDALILLTNTIKHIERKIGYFDWEVKWNVLYASSRNLAVKILLQEIDVRATKKTIAQVVNELEDGNFHHPVEAVMNMKTEISTSDFPMKIWSPDGISVYQHYLKEVQNICNEINKSKSKVA